MQASFRNRVARANRQLLITGLVLTALACGVAAAGSSGWGIALLAGLGIFFIVVADETSGGGGTTSDRVRAGLASVGRRERESPERLLGSDAFIRARRLLTSSSVALDVVRDLASDDDPVVAAAALSALSKRRDAASWWTSFAIRELRRTTGIQQCVLLDALAEDASYPVIGSVLSQLDEDVPWEWIAALVRRRVAAGEPITVETFSKNVPRRLGGTIEQFLAHEGESVADSLRPPYDRWLEQMKAEDIARPVVQDSPMEPELDFDLELLRGIGRVSSSPLDPSPVFLPETRQSIVARLAEDLAAVPAVSFLLVGPHGVGKTALARAAVDRLSRHRLVFEAGSAAVHAGAFYVGELETRLAEIARELASHEIIWFFPAFEDALYEGQHSRSPRGLLDALLPYVQRRELTLVAEATPESYERLVAERPAVASAFHVLRIAPTDATDTAAIAADVLRSKWNTNISGESLRETIALADDFAASSAAPGNVLRIVETAAAELSARGEHRELTTADVLAALSQRANLPVFLLDPSMPLDPGAVRTFFEARVLGQRDAVDSIVDRIAMIKAGVTDPNRPLGVFLFVGPTGTGKTELAKATAEFVFGSQKRLVRVDMSEFRTAESLERLLADTVSSSYGSSLIAEVRESPFSVVLLDEFEKAAPPIWNAFLQVFDDGRLTDNQGRTVDFRRCIIILTSNIGSAIPRGGPLGFGATDDAFRADAVRRTAETWFPPEFTNRLDEIVVFHPLGREQMRALLDKELAAVLDRRGLRSRPWAVMFDETAIDFLIEKGFTVEYGARPLKRAVERSFLGPLARTIVQQHTPEGDQFLFVTATPERGISVAFIDPDADPHADPSDAATDGADLRSIARAPNGNPRTAKFLLDELQRISDAIRGDAVRGRKDAALAEISKAGFWEDERRFEVLDTVEHLDRLEAALRTAERLGERLRTRAPHINGGGRDLVDVLAVRLYVLDAALAALAEDARDDVFLWIETLHDHAGDGGDEFARKLAEMYLAWGARRGMTIRELGAPDGIVLAVAGLGAGKILATENGLHVLERVEALETGARSVERSMARVVVAPWPRAALATGESLEEIAKSAVGRAPRSQEIVRRYRGAPAPLVRDTARGYRTGKLDAVMAGDFDLF